MTDRKSPDVFGRIFTMLASETAPVASSLASRVWDEMKAFDFHPMDMDCDEELFKLGLARVRPDPSFPGDNVTVYKGEPGFDKAEAPLNESDLYYVMDDRQIVGNCVLWWGENRCGYTTELTKAGVYNRQQAEEIAGCRPTDKVYRKTEIDAVAVVHVRAEHIRKFNPLPFKRRGFKPMGPT